MTEVSATESNVSGDLFKEPAPTPAPKLTTRNPEKYVEYYERVAAKLCDKTPIEMRRLAFENTVTAWLDNHPTASVGGICPHCKKSGGVMMPFGGTPKLKIPPTYLHDVCWRPWFVERRRLAVEALREMGITAMAGP